MLGSVKRRYVNPTEWSLQEEDLGMSLAQIAQGQGVSESLVRHVLKIQDVEALPTTAFKDVRG